MKRKEHIFVMIAILILILFLFVKYKTKTNVTSTINGKIVNNKDTTYSQSIANSNPIPVTNQVESSHTTLGEPSTCYISHCIVDEGLPIKYCLDEFGNAFNVNTLNNPNIPIAYCAPGSNVDLISQQLNGA